MRRLILVVLCVACGSKPSAEVGAASPPLELAANRSREIAPATPTQVVVVDAPGRVLAIQGHRTIFQQTVSREGGLPRQISIPVSALAKGDRAPVYVVAVPEASSDGASPPNGHVEDGTIGLKVGPGWRCQGDECLCMPCEPCCPPPSLCSGNQFRCEAGLWRKSADQRACACANPFPVTHGECTTEGAITTFPTFCLHPPDPLP